MTVTVQIPYNLLYGDGVTTRFDFTFDFLEELDLWVLVDGELLAQDGVYNLENMSTDGGEIVFDEAPAQDAVIFIFRDTDRSQQIDYDENEPFPVETHERAGFDKFMFILQELITSTFRGIDITGAIINVSFDLSVTQGAVTVTINNTGGTDAVIPAWTSAEYAGVYHAEIDVEANLPADEAVTTEPDGKVWLGY